VDWEGFGARGGFSSDYKAQIYVIRPSPSMAMPHSAESEADMMTAEQGGAQRG